MNGFNVPEGLERVWGIKNLKNIFKVMITIYALATILLL
jgi:hypothetical protein